MVNWYKKLSYRAAVSGQKWLRGFMRRAKLYKPGFGESKRPKMDVIREEKQSEAVIKKFFDKQEKIHANHTNKGQIDESRDEPFQCNVYNMNEVHTWAKKIGTGGSPTDRAKKIRAN